MKNHCRILALSLLVIAPVACRAPSGTVEVDETATTAGASDQEGKKPENAYQYDSGGIMIPEQAAYDVTFYDLSVRVDPGARTIAGTVIVEAMLGAPLEHFVLDLDPCLDIRRIASIRDTGIGVPLTFERRGGKVWIAFRERRQAGEQVRVEIVYGGTPRIAPNPPWNGGFTWEETESGAPWIATTCQGEGADIWWPVKDHVADEPDRMELHFTVPAPLVVASNGRLKGVTENDDGTRTYHWSVSTPINVYNVALNIAPYVTLERSYKSLDGEAFPVIFYALPEDKEKANELLDEIIDQLRFYESTVGPYPFRADKYGVAQTPHLGMEHQTIIAYGAKFKKGALTGGKDWGFDSLHHHELSHEWWGNLVTNADWSDMWIHEGFGTYMQPLYVEYLHGTEQYHEYIASIRNRIRNRVPVAPPGPKSAKEIFGGDIYFKGAWILHTLRYLIGEETFRMALRRMAYPDPALEAITTGKQCRFATTEEFVELVESLTGRELDWFFNLYLRQPELPELITRVSGERLELEWKVPAGYSFPMPVEVKLGDVSKRVEVPEDGTSVAIPAGVTPEIDPTDWILRKK